MVVGDPDEVSGRPDHTRRMVGDNGLPILQDGEKLVSRAGATSQEADYDVDSDAGEPYDLVAEGDFDIGETAEVGGTTELSGIIESKDDEPFTVEVTWRDDDDNDLVSEDKVALENSTRVDIQSIRVKGDRCYIRVTDTSGAAQNNVVGTLNFH